jgi:predicted metal-dependent HD superfamily phosphohydrolase
MSSKKLFEETIEKALQLLRDKLPAGLDYHNYNHTIDVLNAAIRIGEEEKISSDEMDLLKTAAVLHDAGYIHSRHDHEEQSCRIAEELLSSSGIEKQHIEKICELIRATKIPHHPENKLSEILCDADLDYLGRDDYYPISKNVFREFKKYGVVNDETEWNKLQIKFFESHTYFTPTSIRTRQPKKLEHLQELKERVSKTVS